MNWQHCIVQPRQGESHVVYASAGTRSTLSCEQCAKAVLEEESKAEQTLRWLTGYIGTFVASVGVYALISDDTLWARYRIVIPFDAENKLGLFCMLFSLFILGEITTYFKTRYVAGRLLDRGNTLYGATALVEAVERVRDVIEREGYYYPPAGNYSSAEFWAWGVIGLRYQADFYLLAAIFGGTAFALTHGAPYAAEISGLPIAQFGLDVPPSVGELVSYGINFFTGVTFVFYVFERLFGIRYMMRSGVGGEGRGDFGEEELGEAMKRLEVEGKPYLFSQDL